MRTRPVSLAVMAAGDAARYVLIEVSPQNRGLHMTSRIIHGDCIEELRKLPDHSVDLVLTDPPYGNARAYGKNRRTIANDNHPLTGLLALHECYRVQRRNTAAYYFLDIKHLPLIERFVTQYTDYAIKGWIVWDKVHISVGCAFRNRHEIILALAKGKPEFRDRAFPNVVSVMRERTVEHPHKKPVALLRRLIEHSTERGATVLDPFVGSGSTAVAAKTAGRAAIGIEMDARYVRVARDRIAQATSLPIGTPIPACR